VMGDQTVTVGRIVHYRLSAGDVEAIRVNRTYLPGRFGRGNDAHPGDVYPAIVVRVDHMAETVNLQVLLDGPDTHWVTSARQGHGEKEGHADYGYWSWLPRAGS
jgi:hypothetical protein